VSAALWDDGATARYYDEFTRRHVRSQHANVALVAHAELFAGARVLDLAAGTGLTAEAVLPLIGPSGYVVCVEPASAMRELGLSRVRDSRVAWSPVWPNRIEFDRIVCGAAMWQLPLTETCARAYSRLAPRGAFVFNIPSLYLGLGDEPGGGEDPLLTKLTSLIPHESETDRQDCLSATEIEAALETAGFASYSRWSFRLKLDQAALRDWYKLPVDNRCSLPHRSVDERAAIIDRAYAETDPASWRWEGWLGWTAWK
jgi:SAM-dependent methyltransferase